MERWPVCRANRSHARWRTAAAITLALLSVMVAARSAGAAVTIGQLPASPPSPSCNAMTSADYLQPSVTNGNLYIARQAGTITSWSTNSSGSGATYVFKVLRRTGDPDVFQIMAHSAEHPLTSGLNTVPVSIPVRSGDMIGINETGAPNSCSFNSPGDAVLTRSGNLADGASGTFSPVNNVMLNLSAVLVPSNDFTLGPVSRDRQRGTATMTAHVSNPGLVAISGNGLRKRNASKIVAVAGPVQLKIGSAGARERSLEKNGNVTLTPTVTFYPTGGDPASRTLSVKLKKRRSQQSVQSP